MRPASSGRSARHPRRSADPVRRAAHAALLVFDRTPMHADELVARFAPRGLGARDRAFLRELVYGALRWRNRLDAAYGRFLDKPTGVLAVPVREALRLGCYQLLFLDRVPDHGAVNSSVALLEGTKEARAKGLVNAVLRKVAKMPPQAPAAPEERLVVWESHPDWLVRRWMANLGPERARARCEADNAGPPLVLRVNPMWGGTARLAAELEREGVPTVPGDVDPDCLRIVPAADGRAASFTATDAFQRGAFVVQDEAASLVVRYAGACGGARAWDACAAPGGKTAGLAWAVGKSGMVAATDVARPRLARLRGNCARIQVPVRLLLMDAARPAFGAAFDLVLLDAPCSGLGVLRRHPDARWRLAEEDVRRNGVRQRELLAAVARTVRPGGRLVYAVCSNEPEETEEVVAAFGEPGFVPDGGGEELPPAARRFVGPDGALRIQPEDVPGLDGFFAMRWRRKVEAK